MNTTQPLGFSGLNSTGSKDSTTPRLPGLSPQGSLTDRPADRPLTAIEAAEKVLKVADRHFESSSRSYFKNCRDGVQHYARLQGLQDGFEGRCTKFRLHDRFKHVNNRLSHAMKVSKEIHAELQKAKVAQSTSLQLCNWRLEQRTKKPPREQVKDNLDQALQAEKGRLKESLKALKEHIVQVKQNIDGLQQEIAELHEKGFVPKTAGVFLPEVPEVNGAEEEEPGHEVGKVLLAYLDSKEFTLRKFFRSIDDGNGRIEKHEWMQGLKDIKFTDPKKPLRKEKDCATLFGAVDDDLTGSISWKELEQYYDELLKVVRSKHPCGKELVIFIKEEGYTLRRLWQHIDDGNDGKVEMDEFLIGMASVGFIHEGHPAKNTNSLKEFFLAADTDRSGIISWQEFQSVLSELCNGARCGKVKKLNKVATKKLHELNDFERNAIKLRDSGHEMIRTSTSECGLLLRHVGMEMTKQVNNLTKELKKLKHLQRQTEVRVENQVRLCSWKDHAEIHDEEEILRTDGREFAESPDLIAAAENLHSVPAEEIPKDHALHVLEGVLAKLNASVKDKMDALTIDQNCQTARIIGDQLIIKAPSKADTHSSLASTADTVRSGSKTERSGKTEYRNILR